MIPEEYVTLPTAKLLRDAGFPKDGCSDIYQEPTGRRRNGPFGREDIYDYIPKPTQAQAMRWLREHEVVVIVDVEYFRYDIKNAKYRYNIYPNDCAKQTRSQYTYPTYEAAAEAGIQAARKYLIEKGGEE